MKLQSPWRHLPIFEKGLEEVEEDQQVFYCQVSSVDKLHTPEHIA